MDKIKKLTAKLLIFVCMLTPVLELLIAFDAVKRKDVDVIHTYFGKQEFIMAQFVEHFDWGADIYTKKYKLQTLLDEIIRNQQRWARLSKKMPDFVHKGIKSLNNWGKVA